MILKLVKQHQGRLYKGYLNDDPGLTLTYFTARLNCVVNTFEWGKTVTKLFNGQNMQQRTRLTEFENYEKQIPMGVVCPYPGAKYMYEGYLESS